MGAIAKIISGNFITTAIKSIVAMLDDDMKAEMKANVDKVDEFTDKIPPGYSVAINKGKDGKVYAYLAKSKDVYVESYERFCITDMVKDTITNL